MTKPRPHHGIAQRRSAAPRRRWRRITVAVTGGSPGAGSLARWFLRQAKAGPWKAVAFRPWFAAAFAALLVAMFSAAAPSPARAATADIAALNGAYFTVNNGPRDQTDPYVSGDWVSYTDNSTGSYRVHYYNLATGQDAAVPGTGGQDLLSGISGTTIVYMHSTATSEDIYTHDIGSGAQAELDPAPGSIRGSPAIGGRTVAWSGFTADPAHPQIVVENLDTGQVTTLTNDTTMKNLEPFVARTGRW